MKQKQMQVTDNLINFLKTDFEISPLNLFKLSELLSSKLEEDAIIVQNNQGPPFIPHYTCDYIGAGYDMAIKVFLIRQAVDGILHEKETLHPFLKAYLEEVGATEEFLKEMIAEVE